MPDDHQPPHPAGRRPDSPPAGERLGRLEDRVEGLLAVTRVLVLIPVIVLVLAAATIFVYAAVVFFATLPGLFTHPVPVGHKWSVFVVEIDLFLIGATLIIAAFGLYELFIGKISTRPSRFSLPVWLQMRDLNDLKARVASMLILVAAVTFVDMLLADNLGPDLLYVGAAVALVIGALVAFLAFGSDSETDSDSESGS